MARLRKVTELSTYFCYKIAHHTQKFTLVWFCNSLLSQHEYIFNWNIYFKSSTILCCFSSVHWCTCGEEEVRKFSDIAEVQWNIQSSKPQDLGAGFWFEVFLFGLGFFGFVLGVRGFGGGRIFGHFLLAFYFPKISPMGLSGKKTCSYRRIKGKKKHCTRDRSYSTNLYPSPYFSLFFSLLRLCFSLLASIRRFSSSSLLTSPLPS